MAGKSLGRNLGNPQGPLSGVEFPPSVPLLLRAGIVPFSPVFLGLAQWLAYCGSKVFAMDWTSRSPQNSHVGALAHNMTVFGDRAFKRSLELDEVTRLGLLWRDWCPYEKRCQEACFCLSMHTEDVWSRDGGTCQPRDLGMKPTFAGTLILDFWPPELWELYSVVKAPSVIFCCGSLS